MFTSLLFLVLILMTVSLSPDVVAELPPFPALAIGLVAYGACLLIITAQTLLARRLLRAPPRGPLLLFANLDLFLFFLLFHLILGSHTLYWFTFPSQTVVALISLALYFIGLYTFEKIYLSRHAWPQIRFLLPFALPFLFFDITFDLLNLTNLDIENPLITLALSLALLFLLLIFFPYIIQRAWGCRPLPPGPLRDRLDSTCEQLRFRHAGMKTWPVMRHAMTAAILGVVRRFRYVIFTEGLIRNLTIDETEAVLIHEIGHSRHRHLLLYPLILLGMVVLLTLALALPLSHPLTLTLALALIAILYFRTIFGLFSRNFERQADLYILHTGLPAQRMINALDRIAILNGNIHEKPSWHHGSIRSRIDFLRRAEIDPSLATRHHRRVRQLLFSYLALLILGIAAILVLALV